ncbi:hypothetical protein PTTG_26785 [Puccinia triticina 1-1 BBBD Race 1]|uniref:Uncharacterized protein n=1 Tax=Puccinia triticina (isolate 1-1 / race 1 (BBBD)) TaxID=630390 RepID=A0A180GR49_PUCT1|nr:hypothetical protein PTTG_26785 [Puccinia triticina 1-1 BBBD Race 1]
MAPSYAIPACLPPLALMTRLLLPHGHVTVRSTVSDYSQTGRRSILASLQILRSSIHGDHNLLLLGICYGLYCFIAGSSTVKLQYAASKFAWDAVEIGEYLTIVGVSKVASLLFIIPGIMYVWNRKTNDSQVANSLVDGSVMEGQNLPGDVHYGRMDQDCSNSTLQAKPAAAVFGYPSTNTSQSSLTLCQSEIDATEDGTRWKAATINQELALNRFQMASSISRHNYQTSQLSLMPCEKKTMLLSTEAYLGMELPPHSTEIDLSLARFSIGWGVICSVGLVFSQNMLSFIIPSALEALSRSTGPAIQAVVLSLITINNKNIGSTDVISSFSLIGILMYDLLGEFFRQIGKLFIWYVYVNSRSTDFSKSFLFVIAALKMTKLTLIRFVNISGKNNVDEESCRRDETGD